MDYDRSAHWVYSEAMAEARIRFELAFEKFESKAPLRKDQINWADAGSAQWLLSKVNEICEFIGVDEASVTERYGE